MHILLGNRKKAAAIQAYEQLEFNDPVSSSYEVILLSNEY